MIDRFDDTLLTDFAQTLHLHAHNQLQLTKQQAEHVMPINNLSSSGTASKDSLKNNFRPSTDLCIVCYIG